MYISTHKHTCFVMLFVKEGHEGRKSVVSDVEILVHVKFIFKSVQSLYNIRWRPTARPLGGVLPLRNSGETLLSCTTHRASSSVCVCVCFSYSGQSTTMAFTNHTHAPPSYNVSTLVLGSNSSISPSVSSVQSEASRGIQITATLLIFLVRLLRSYSDSNQLVLCETETRPEFGQTLASSSADLPLARVEQCALCLSVLF